jgi:acyl-CoA hydrolase
MGMLMRRGVITNARKSMNVGKTVGAFALGDDALYELMCDNPKFELRRAAYTNNPFQIAQNDNMVSINTAIEIDLTGQVCSESIGSTQFSGTGGAADFAYGAYHAKGGRGIIALPATTKGGTVSKIVAQLTSGAVVSISRNLTDYVVTEYGIAHLRDRSIRQRAEGLIAVAAPEFRQELRAQADRLMLW